MALGTLFDVVLSKYGSPKILIKTNQNNAGINHKKAGRGGKYWFNINAFSTVSK